MVVVPSEISALSSPKIRAVLSACANDRAVVDLASKLAALERCAPPHPHQLWELHADHDRIDLTALWTNQDRRSMRRAQQWCQHSHPANAAYKKAATMLCAWLADQQHLRSLYWEADANQQAVGVFACPLASVNLEQALSLVQKTTALPHDLLQYAHTLLAPLSAHNIVNGWGTFVGRHTPPELRVNLRSDCDHWLQACPLSVREDMTQLARTLPDESVFVPVLGIQQDRIRVALEAKPRVNPKTQDAQRQIRAWVDAVFPVRSAVQEAVLAPFLDANIDRVLLVEDEPLLLDAFVKRKTSLPVVQAHINHVKVRFTDSGQLERKLYLAVATQWRPIGGQV